MSPHFHISELLEKFISVKDDEENPPPETKKNTASLKENENFPFLGLFMLLGCLKYRPETVLDGSRSLQAQRLRTGTLLGLIAAAQRRNRWTSLCHRGVAKDED